MMIIIGTETPILSIVVSIANSDEKESPSKQQQLLITKCLRARHYQVFYTLCRKEFMS